MKKYLLALVFGFSIVLQGQSASAQIDDIYSDLDDAPSAQTVDKNILVDRELMKNITPEQLEECIAQGADVNAKSNGGEITPLMYAAEYNKNPKITEILIKNGADVNAKDGDYATVLMYAIENENPEIVEILMKSGADVNAMDIDDETVLIKACRSSNIKIIKTLLDNAATVEDSKLLLDMLNQNENIEVNQEYLDLRSRIYTENSEQTDGSAYDNSLGNIAKKRAIYKDLLTNVKLMKTATPEKLVEYIIEGADVNAVVTSGRMEGATVLTIASVYSPENLKTDIIKTLVKAGADVNQKMTLGNEQGITILMLIIKEKGVGNQEIAKILIDEGVDVNSQVGSGRYADMTPLMLAVKEDKFEYVKMLMDAGADVNIMTKEGKTAMDFAYESGNSEIVELLKKATVKKQTKRVFDSITMLITNIITSYANANDYKGLSTETAYEKALFPYDMKIKANIKASDAINKGDNKAFVVQVKELPKETCIYIATSNWGNNIKFGTQKLGKYLTTPLTIENATEACDCEENQCVILLKGQ